MATYPVAELAQLREIGWREWDPIGLIDSDCPRDEYDAYLLQFVSRLRRGEPVSTVVDYLERVGSVTMGLGSPNDATRRASHSTVLSIKAYLETLPDGPLQIR